MSKEADYDDYVKDIEKHKTKPIRQEADFTKYKVVDYVDQISGKIKYMIIDPDQHKYSVKTTDCTNEILELLNVYQIKNVIIYDDVANFILDKKPDAFDGVEDLVINEREEE